jgi:hypothetical protein
MPSEDKRLHASLQFVRRAIEGRPTLILGSAPSACAPKSYDPDTWALVCINASGRIALELGLGTPCVTILAASVFTEESKTSIEARAALAGLQTDVAIVRLVNRGVVSRVLRMARIQWRIHHLEYRYGRLHFLSPFHWQPIARPILEPLEIAPDNETSTNISTGIFACILATWLGASKVVVGGIDPSSTGHAYSTSNHPRKHIFADTRAARILQEEHGVEFLSGQELTQDKMALPRFS